MTIDKLIAELDRSLQFPGVSNALTMPIKARIDMLSTGIRTPVGVKVLGTDLAEMEKLARQTEAVLRTVPGTTSAYAERAIGGYYLNIDPDRGQLARYGDGRRPTKPDRDGAGCRAGYNDCRRP
jgi:copper/silver efflux system protein